MVATAVIALVIALVSLIVSLVSAARPLLQRPELDLEYDNGPDDLINVDTVRVSRAADYIEIDEGAVRNDYLRLRVCNRKRWLRVVSQSASNVQVLAFIRSGAGRVGLDYRALPWSSASPKPEDPVLALSIPVGVERHIDVAVLTIGGASPGARVLAWPRPTGGGDQVPAGKKVEILLTVTCDEAPAKFWTVVLRRDDASQARKLDFEGTHPLRGHGDTRPTPSAGEQPRHGPIQPQLPPAT